MGPDLADAPEARSRTPDTAAVAVVGALLGAAVAGVAQRVWILASPLGAADSDESVVGLMARHLLDGELTAFYWGQPYGGMHEPALSAALFAVFGSGPLVMKLVPLGLSVVAAFLIWRIGRRTVGEPGALIAAVCFWAAPTAFVWLSTKERGFYGATMTLGLTVVLMAIRLRDRASWRDAAVLGLAGGSGWYANPQVIYLVGPALAWLAIISVKGRRSDLLRLSWVAAAGAVVGALPWLVANLHSDWASLSVPPVPIHTTYLERLELVFKTGLPIALGLKVPYGGHWLVPGLGLVAYVSMFVLVAHTVLRHRRRTGILLVIVALYPFLVALPATSFYVIEPRYLFLLWPVLALLIARLVGTLDHRVQVLAVVALVALSVGGTASLMTWNRSHPGNYDLAAGDIGPLLGLLRSEEIDHTFADYWVAYRINLETRELVSAASLGFVRYLPYQDRVRSSARPAYVLFAGSDPDRRLGPALRQLPVTYRRLRAGQYAVYLPDRKVLPEEVPVW